MAVLFPIVDYQGRPEELRAGDWLPIVESDTIKQDADTGAVYIPLVAENGLSLTAPTTIGLGGSLIRDTLITADVPNTYTLTIQDLYGLDLYVYNSNNYLSLYQGYMDLGCGADDGSYVEIFGESDVSFGATLYLSAQKGAWNLGIRSSIVVDAVTGIEIKGKLKAASLSDTTDATTKMLVADATGQVYYRAVPPSDWNTLLNKPTEFAPASGSGYYIQNQVAAPQAAGFRIDGVGTAGRYESVSGNNLFNTTDGASLFGYTTGTTSSYKVDVNGRFRVTGTFFGVSDMVLFKPGFTVPANQYDESAPVTISPTMKLSFNNQFSGAVKINPTWNLNGFTLNADGGVAALKIVSAYTGLSINQTSTGTTYGGQALDIFQGAGIQKEGMRIYRNNNTTNSKAFILVRDDRDATIQGSLIPVFRYETGITTSMKAGGGISWHMDRRFWGPEAEISMYYMQDVSLGVQTAIHLKPSGATTGLKVEHGGHVTLGGKLKIGQFATGTALYNLVVDSAGNVMAGSSPVGGNTGTVTSVDASISGALNVAGNPITTNGTLAFSWTGAATNYVKGDGTLGTLASVASSGNYGDLAGRLLFTSGLTDEGNVISLGGNLTKDTDFVTVSDGYRISYNYYVPNARESNYFEVGYDGVYVATYNNATAYSELLVRGEWTGLWTSDTLGDSAFYTNSTQASAGFWLKDGMSNYTLAANSTSIRIGKNAATGSFSGLLIDSTGAITLNMLAGTGSRGVFVDANGVLSAQVIPPADWNTLLNKPTQFTPASGSGYYIHNQTSSVQTAGFKIDGNGTIAGVLDVGTAGVVATHVLRSRYLTYSFTPTGLVMETNSGTSPASLTMNRNDGVNNNMFVAYTTDGTVTATKPSWYHGFKAGSYDFTFKTNDGTTDKERLVVATTGAVTISNLAGTGTRIVVADANGLLLTQPLITYSGTDFIQNQIAAAQTANGWINGLFYISDATVTTGNAYARGITINKSVTDIAGINLVNRNSAGSCGITFASDTAQLGLMVYNRSTSQIELTSGLGLQFRSFSSDINFYSGQAGRTIMTVKTINGGGVSMSGNFVTSNGSGTFTALTLNPTLNQTGTATGSVMGLYYNPTVTSVMGTHYGLYMSVGKNYFGDNVLIGTTTDNGNKLQVNGTTKTTSLLVNTAALTAGYNLELTGSAYVHNSQNIAVGTPGMLVAAEYVMDTDSALNGYTYVGAAHRGDFDIRGARTMNNGVIPGGAFYLLRLYSNGGTGNSLTMDQGSGGSIRAVAAAQYFVQTPGNSDVSLQGTISHVAGILLQAPDTYGTNAHAITNYYGLAINDSADHGAAITNRYGIYQVGASDQNVFAGSSLFSVDPTLQATARVDIHDTDGYSQLRLRSSYTPVVDDVNGQVGSIVWDDDFVYVRTSTGWKKAALTAV